MPISADLDVLAYIFEVTGAKLCPPTVRDILERYGFSSTSVVVYRLRRLEREGLVVQAEKAGRWSLTPEGALAARAWLSKGGVRPASCALCGREA